MQKKKNIGFIVFSVLFYAVTLLLLAYATGNDLALDKKLFDPENTIVQIAESYSQFVYWGIWGIAFAIIFVCRHDLNDSLRIIGNILPFVKTVDNTESKAYKFFNFIVKAVTTIGFFILCGVGWKKLIENVIKNILVDTDNGELSQAVYFIISFIVAAISIILVSRINKRVLQKLELLALAGVLLGIFYKIVEECKDITSRVRFREMVAYSNNFLTEDGLSEGKYSPLSKDMAYGVDFSAFTRWYQKGDDMGIYNRADSFPSGHTTYACSTFLSVLFCSSFEKLKKFTPLAVGFSTVYVFAVGFTRLVAGAHYLSDVAAAAIIGYTLFLIVRAIYNSFYSKSVLMAKNTCNRTL